MSLNSDPDVSTLGPLGAATAVTTSGAVATHSVLSPKKAVPPPSTRNIISTSWTPALFSIALK